MTVHLVSPGRPGVTPGSGDPPMAWPGCARSSRREQRQPSLTNAPMPTAAEASHRFHAITPVMG
jgi:hypothetical protein